jgi:hypothetical protein
MQRIILALLVSIVIMLSVCIYKQQKEGYEGSCYQPLSKAYLPYKCFNQPNFQEFCVKQVQDNQTVSQLIADQVCGMSQPILYDEPAYPF